MSHQWLVIGISGATCSGKSTLARNLHDMFPQSITICQDDYFLPPDSPHHVMVESLGHVNWELMSALDMKRMKSDVHSLLLQDPSSAILPTSAKQSKFGVGGENAKKSTRGTYRNVLILEGFLLLNDDELCSVCDLRYYLTLSREQCWERRRVRVYDPPDIPGYFDAIVWPEYEKNSDEVLMRGNVKVISGTNSIESITADVQEDIQDAIARQRRAV